MAVVQVLKMPFSEAGRWEGKGLLLPPAPASLLEQSWPRAGAGEGRASGQGCGTLRGGSSAALWGHWALTARVCHSSTAVNVHWESTDQNK